MINDFEMSTLKTERVENKFLNFKFFWKDDENAKNNVNIEMSTLKTERVENKFLNFKLFWKDDENAKNNVNMPKIYF
jgi:uncharacterized protein YcfL